VFPCLGLEFLGVDSRLASSIRRSFEEREDTGNVYYSLFYNGPHICSFFFRRAVHNVKCVATTKSDVCYVTDHKPSIPIIGAKISVVDCLNLTTKDK
jgi:hypothetical protein